MPARGGGGEIQTQAGFETGAANSGRPRDSEAREVFTFKFKLVPVARARLGLLARM